MRAPRLTPEERREVERFGIHEDDARRAHVLAVLRGFQIVGATAVGIGIVVVIVLGVLVVVLP